jgi:serine/threonine protein kinase
LGAGNTFSDRVRTEQCFIPTKHSYLGSGYFSRVYQAEMTKTRYGLAPGAAVAVKELHPHFHVDPLAEVSKYVTLSKQPEFVHLVHVFRDPVAGSTSLVFKLCEGGNLEEHIKAAEAPYTEAAIIRTAHTLVRALRFLADNDLVHTDISCRNLFLTDRSGALDIRIGDFGCAVWTRNGSDSIHQNSVNLAPETVVVGGKHTIASDVFSAGCVLLTLMTRIHPRDMEQQRKTFASLGESELAALFKYAWIN